MFDRVCKYNISRRDKDYIYNFKTSKDIEYEVIFEYHKAGVCALDYKNLTENSFEVINYKDSTSIELFSTLVAIISDFVNLIAPDEMVLSYNKRDPISRYKLTKRLINLFKRKYKNKTGFTNITYEEIDKGNKINFYLKRNVENTLLQLKRKRLNKRDEV